MFTPKLPSYSESRSLISKAEQGNNIKNLFFQQLDDIHINVD